MSNLPPPLIAMLVPKYQGEKRRTHPPLGTFFIIPFATDRPQPQSYRPSKLLKRPRKPAAKSLLVAWDERWLHEGVVVDGEKPLRGFHITDGEVTEVDVTVE